MNFRANEAETASFNIPQAAKVLKVTDKTIRNYIDRGFLRAEKWNGSWRIEKRTLLKIYWKKYGNTMESSSLERNHVQVPLGEYDWLQRQSGQLEASERLVEELKANLERSLCKAAELEASSASGWTEARTQREEKGFLEKELKTVRRRERQVSLKLLASSDKLKAIRAAEQKARNEIKELEDDNREMKRRIEIQEGKLKRYGQRLRTRTNRQRRMLRLGDYS